MPYDTFVSYSRSDKDHKEGFVKLLEAAGRTPFDDSQIKPGAFWEDELTTAMSKSTYVFVLWCCHSSESPWVRKEIDQALAEKKSIVPVILCKADVPPDVAKFQWIEWWSFVRHECEHRDESRDERKEPRGDQSEALITYTGSNDGVPRPGEGLPGSETKMDYDETIREHGLRSRMQWICLAGIASALIALTGTFMWLSPVWGSVLAVTWLLLALFLILRRSRARRGLTVLPFESDSADYVKKKRLQDVSNLLLECDITKLLLETSVFSCGIEHLAIKMAIEIVDENPAHFYPKPDVP